MEGGGVWARPCEERHHVEDWIRYEGPDLL
jgi:hypothetical protein